MTKSRRIALSALFIALSVVLTRFLSIRIVLFGVEGIRIGLGDLPILLAGFLLGPIEGAVVGAVSDIVGYLISPMAGPYMPHFTLTSAVEGWLPAMLYKYVFKKSGTFRSIFVAIAIGQFIVSVIMVPYFIHILFGIPYALLMPSYSISYGIALLIYPLFIWRALKFLPNLSIALKKG